VSRLFLMPALAGCLENEATGGISADDITVNPGAKTIVVGMKRVDLITDAEMTGSSTTMKIGAAVGSNMAWNDDIYSSSAEITVTGTAGITEVGNTELTIYPNPASGSIYLETKDGLEITAISILDLTGKEVLHLDEDSIHSTIDISQLENGIYIGSVMSQNGAIHTKRFVVSQ